MKPKRPYFLDIGLDWCPKCKAVRRPHEQQNNKCKTCKTEVI